VRRCTVGQFIAGPHRPDEQGRLHAAKVYLQPLERLAVFDADPVPWLRFPGEPVSPRRLALHPGSGSEAKNWPEVCWVGLLERLVQRTDLDLLLVGGEAEGERLQRLAAVLPPARTLAAQSLPLPQLARMLQGCGAFVGHDSGISHLAAAVGLPALVLWGRTAEEIWRPPSDKVRIVRHSGGLELVTVEEVFDQVLSLTAAQ
jgi:ADP-heptose:LPS heptosyltransferase